jgi:hypothetical protein
MSHAINSGRRYKIMNVATGFVIDLSGVDNRSIIGWYSHGGDNQKVRAVQYLGPIRS